STANYVVVETIPLPSNVSAGFIKITPDGSQAWLGEFPLYRGVSSIIVVISTGTFDTNTITLPKRQSPGAILFSPDSTTAYVPVNGPQIAVMNVATRKAVALIDSISSVNGLAISPDGNREYVTDFGSGALAAVDTASKKVVYSVPVGSEPECRGFTGQLDRLCG
ncbi:MAG: hypothetical protein WBZ19_12920, partial [Chthoniobacterales bacterium]